MIKKIFVILIICISIAHAQTGFDENKYALSQAYVQGGQYEKALPILQQLYNSAPNNYQFFQALNDVYTQLKNYDASIALIEDQIKMTGTNINLYGMLGTTYYLKGNENKAFEVWDNALKVLPESDVNYRVIANYAVERRAFDKAIGYLKKGQDISKNPIFFAYDLANLYALTMQFADATEEYCIILSQNPNQFQVMQNKILSYISKPDALNKALPVVEKYSHSSNVDFKILLARLYLEDKNYDGAYKIYKKVDDALNSGGIQLYNFAQYLFDEKNFTLAAKVYNDIINTYPNTTIISSARLGYAKTLEATLQSDEAGETPGWKPFYAPVKTNESEVNKVISAFVELTKAYPNTEIANESFLRIGNIELNKKNNLDDAEKYFEEITNKAPLSQYAPDAFLSLARTELIKGNLSEAISFCKTVVNGTSYSKEKKNDAEYFLGRLSFYQGNFPEAKIYLKNILDNLNNNTANDALELSLLMNTSQGDSSNLLTFASAELLAEQRNFGAAEEKYKLVTSDPQKFMLQNLAMFRQAQMELALNNYDTTVALLKKISDENEKNIYADKALYLLGKIYQFGLKDKAKAVETYENLLAKFPNSLYLDDARAQIIKLRDKLS